MRHTVTLTVTVPISASDHTEAGAVATTYAEARGFAVQHVSVVPAPVSADRK